MKLPYRILILDDDENIVSGLVELLREMDYDVTAAVTFEAAKRLLGLSSYDLLITDVRLRGFNGLHLVQQCRHEQPDMALIIMSGYDEPLIDLEANRYQATFLRKPFQPAQFLKVVGEALASVRRIRRWPRKRVEGGFRVRAAGRPAAVLDVGYGGLRLEIAEAEALPDRFDIELSGIGLQLQVQPVWSYPSKETGGVVCGAALASHTSPAARTWRTIVDRLSA